MAIYMVNKSITKYSVAQLFASTEVKC